MLLRGNAYDYDSYYYLKLLNKQKYYWFMGISISVGRTKERSDESDTFNQRYCT